MNFEGQYSLNAPRERVWTTIRDPAKLASAFDDFRDLAIVSPTVFTANGKVGVSVIRGTFRFRFEVVEESAPTHLVTVVRGRGIGSAVDLKIDVRLEERGATTDLLWAASVQVSGTLAGIAQRLLEQSAERTIRDVFENLKKVVER
ncbi:MAG: CoxG family protein [Thermoplasmata archaeon]